MTLLGAEANIVLVCVHSDKRSAWNALDPVRKTWPVGIRRRQLSPLIRIHINC
jgi:hypothetical protein